MTAKRISDRELTRLAFANAAALLENEELPALFGEELFETYHDDDSLEDRCDAAQKKAVAYLRKRAGATP